MRPRKLLGLRRHGLEVIVVAVATAPLHLVRVRARARVRAWVRVRVWARVRDGVRVRAQMSAPLHLEGQRSPQPGAPRQHLVRGKGRVGEG